MKNISLILLTTLIFNSFLFSQTFDWVKQFKTSNKLAMSSSKTILTNSLGELFIVGYYRDTVDFDPSVNTLNLISQDRSSSFICKLDSAGELLWVKEFKGNADVITYEMGFDNQENIILVGSFKGTCDFDCGVDSAYLTSVGGKDGFILKLTPNGDFVWVKNIVGLDDQIVMNLSIDSFNNIYIGGNFYGVVNFDLGNSNFSLTSIAYLDVFICKINESGNFIWAKQIGGVDNDFFYDISIDLANNIYVGGSFFDSCNFDPSGINLQISSNGGSFIENGFISKWDAFGNLIWAECIGGTGGATVKEIAIDEVGHVYVMGGFKDTMDVDFSNNVFQLATISSYRGSFILKIDSTNNFIWAKQISPPNYGVVDIYGSTLDEYGNIYVTGVFDETVDFNPNIGVYNLFSDYENDIFILKLDSLGDFGWAVQFVDNSQITHNFAYSIAVDNQNNVYTTGTYTSFCDFDIGPNTFYFSNTFNPCLFVHKINQLGVGISENEFLNSTTVYPNPSNGVFYIETKLSKPQDFILTELNGKILLTGKTGSNKTELDLSRLRTGVYFLKIDNSVVKLIKQ